MYKYNKSITTMSNSSVSTGDGERVGSLELIIGPMYAGKSTELIRIINRFKCLKKNVLVVNHSFNNRYDSNGLTTHNRQSFDECIIVDTLGKVMSEEHIEAFENADVIVIEELQFFGDAYDIVVDWINNRGKCVVGAGLDGDSNQQPFGDVLRLIPHAEEVRKLNALCKRCGDGTSAPFTKKIIKNDDKILVGSDAIYEAVCRRHLRDD